MAGQLLRAVILGAPASGKGTISARIVKQFNIQHISSGDILRNHVRNKTKIGSEANQYINSGLLVPDKLILKMIEEELQKYCKINWLLDGVPRTKEQAEQLYNNFPVNVALNLVVPFDVILERVRNRWVHIPSGRVYNLDFNAPKVAGLDDVTGEVLEQREDDKPEAVKKRLDIYSNTTKPVIDFYKSKGILCEFHGETSNEIWPKVENALKALIEK